MTSWQFWTSLRNIAGDRNGTSSENFQTTDTRSLETKAYDSYDE